MTNAPDQQKRRLKRFIRFVHFIQLCLGDRPSHRPAQTLPHRPVPKLPHFPVRKIVELLVIGLGIEIGIEVGVSRQAAIARSVPVIENHSPQPSATPLSSVSLSLLAQQLLPQLELPSDPRPILPSPDELLRSPTRPLVDDSIPDDTAITIFVERFEVTGNTAFNDEELAIVLKPFTQRDLSLSELYEARTAVTRLYLDNGYVLSGAYIPPQEPDNNVVRMEVIEGRLTEIDITGHQRLRSQYIQNRLARVGEPPLKLDQLVDQLRLLQLNPLIDNISGDLSAGLVPGTGILTVMVDEADSFDIGLFTNNDRTPSIGSWERGLTIAQHNLTGRGDGLSVDYANTNGSHDVTASYTIPVNPRNGTVNLSHGRTDSHVIEDPFDVLDIDAESRYYELTYRQPIVETPSETVALSLTASRQESRSLFLEDLLGEQTPFPALGADDEGRIRVSALRFAQEWVKQRPDSVLALRSQFNVGLDVFDPTISDDTPDSRFASWEGQAQWANLLASDTLLLLRTEAQLSGDRLLPLERMGLGGRRTVRGYRQDVLLTDNGLLVSAELRLPVYRNRRQGTVVQVIPFLDVGTGWSAAGGQTPETNTIVGTGLGLQWRQGDRFTARLDWGVPLTTLNFGFSEGTLQEDGLYFSFRYNAL